MTDTLTHKPASTRGTGLALVLFLIVYAATMALLLAPRGAFVTTPANVAASRD
ncbi:hypothetical protein [Fuscovulum blasticum]|uniref:hypothetical protein n=1 Tax=Fuscovulum blasticum TaxID=1075 RepID=UPI0013E0DD45|nr:hypothetical protein [Fuscovulum blasticum]